MLAVVEVPEPPCCKFAAVAQALSNPPPLFTFDTVTGFKVDEGVIEPGLLTVAIAVLEDTQAFVAAAVPEPVNVEVPPIQTVSGDPEIVGRGFTVTVTAVRAAERQLVVPSVTST